MSEARNELSWLKKNAGFYNSSMIIAFSQSNKGLPLQLHKARRTCASCIHLFPSERVNPALCLSLRFFFIHPFIHGETEAFVHTHVGIFKNTFFSASREIIIITEKKTPSKPRVKEKIKKSLKHTKRYAGGERMRKPRGGRVTSQSADRSANQEV